MADYPELIPPDMNIPPRRKDQRFPPRYHKRADRKPTLTVGMSILQLLKKVGKVQLQNSRYVRIKRVQYNQKKNLYKFTTETWDPIKKQTRIHTQRIYPADRSYQGKLIDCPAIKVTCNDPSFCYFFEVSLSYWGCSDIIYSSGAFPIHNNPQLLPRICKHILKDFLFLVQEQL